VFRHTFNNIGSVASASTFTAGPEVLRVRAKAFDAAVVHLTPGELRPDESAVPFELLGACDFRESHCRRWAG
jgi:hypothetical protein